MNRVCDKTLRRHTEGSDFMLQQVLSQPVLIRPGIAGLSLSPSGMSAYSFVLIPTSAGRLSANYVASPKRGLRNACCLQ